MNKCVSLMWLLIAAVVWTATARAETLPPLEAFFKPAKMHQASLSPSGRWLAALTSEGQRHIGFLMIDLEGKEAARFIQASDKDDVIWFNWVTEDWLVFRVDDPSDRSAYGIGTGLMAMSRDGTSSRMLISREWDNGELNLRRALDPNHYYLGLGTPGRAEVIVAEAHYDVNREYSHTTLKVIDLDKQTTRSMLDDPPRADEWWLDAMGRARVAAWTDGPTTAFFWADAKTGHWRQLAQFPRANVLFRPMYVQGDDALVVGTSDEKGHLELRAYDFDKGRPANNALLKTPGYYGNVAPIWPRGASEVLGLHLLVDSWTTTWFAPSMRDLQTTVDAKFQGHVNLLSCRPCDNPRTVLIYSYSDTDPGSYVLYTPSKEKWQLVGQRRPDIDPAQMAPLELHRVTARDGVELPVWVTRPQQARSGSRLSPAVVLVHGGPWVRGTQWEWNAEAQFLASRGYVVIEPEFRGSNGYGVQHLRAGFKQWGQAMQDDLTDALSFAVRKGWVDPGRVCIMGSSYGGYATLMGLVKDPDQYRCGIAFAPVVDPRFMFDFHWSDISSDAKTYSLPTRMGDRKLDNEMFAANAPLEHADRIKVPVLLAHGSIDRRVPVQNGERMRDALRKRGKLVDWVLYTDEGHGFKYVDNKLDYYRRVEQFLRLHLENGNR